MDKRFKWKAGPTRTQRHAKTEMTPEANSSRSSQGHTGACQDGKAPAALTGGRNSRDEYAFPIGEKERERGRRPRRGARAEKSGRGPDLSVDTAQRRKANGEKQAEKTLFQRGDKRTEARGSRRPEAAQGITRFAAWCDRGSSMRSRSGPPLPSGERRRLCSDTWPWLLHAIPEERA